MKKLKAMILEEVQHEERFTQIVAEDIETKDIYLMTFVTDQYTGEVGKVYEFDVMFMVKDKFKNQRRYLNQSIKVKSMRIA